MNEQRFFRGNVALAVLILLVQEHATLQAVDPQQRLTRYLPDQWTTRNGLPHNNVVAIAQTADGYLWLGTQEGLCRFDGARFTSIEAVGHPRSFPGLALHPARDGSLWLTSSSEGLWKLRGGQLHVVATPFRPGENLSGLWEEANGTLWVGVAGRELWVCREGQWTTWTPPGNLPGRTFSCIHIAHDGSLWLGTDCGLCRVRDGCCVTYSARDGLPDNAVTCVQEGADGSLWIGTNGGLARLCGKQITAYTTRDGLPSNLIRGLCVGRGNALWVATLGGLARVHKETIESFTTRQGLSSNRLRAVWEDKEGSVWIATLTGGLNRLKEPLVRTYGVEEGLLDDFAWSVCPSQGSLWIGTNSGLWQLKDGRFRGYTTRDGLPSNTVRALCPDRDGSLWIGTVAGLAHLQGGRITPCTVHAGLGNDCIFAILQDRSGTLWLGTGHGGLKALRDGKITAYTAPRDLPSAGVRCLAEDPSGALWIATHSGLARYKDGRFTAYTRRKGLRSNLVLGVTADAAGNVWICTYGSGLGRWRQGQITSYGPAEGLPDSVIYHAVEDNRGGMWLSCDRGIFRLRKQDLDDLDAGRLASVPFVLYGTADGMRACECNGGNQSAGCCAPDGHLWFPTMQGIVTLDPATLRSTWPVPPVLLEQVLVNRQPIGLQENPTLPPGKRELEFRYTALSFLTPERLSFRYRLEGYDPDWVPAGTRREAFYTNLSPGTYRFRVQASHGNGVWGEAQPSFVLHLQPSFYETGWFYAACGAAILGLGLAGHKLRVRLLEASERLLQLRVRQRTCELQLAEAQARQAQQEAESALAQVKQLRGLLPICSYCKKIRDDGDYWHQLEAYLGQHTDAQFSHGICPECWSVVVQPMLEGSPESGEKSGPA